MKRLLFITSWDFGDGPSTGITKKIKSQIKAFRKYNYIVDYTYIENNQAMFCQCDIEGNIIKKRELGKVGSLRKLAAYFYYFRELKRNNCELAKSYDFVYSRYGLSDKYYYKLLKLLKVFGCINMVEIPTFPYDDEKLPGLVWDVLYGIDKFYRRKLYKVVDKIVTYSHDDRILGVDTIKIINGIDFDNISLKNNITERNPNNINLLTVAGLANWHGYDRLLRGMGEYYRNNNERKVIFHIVGDGPVLPQYKKIVENYQIEEYVKFYGVKQGEELDVIYDIADMGVENLGFHRSGVFISSSLKSREYSAKGIPFITSCEIDGFNECDFVYRFPTNDDDINIYEIIQFYDKIYGNAKNENISEYIRNSAKKICSMKSTLKPVVDVMENNL